MNTISTISSISFNTPQFFEMKIKELSALGKGQIFDWCHWILHKPDTDQKKPHIHFVCKPSRRVDTNWLRQQFQEPVTDVGFIQEQIKNGVPPETFLKPLGVLPFCKTTSMTDWLLYAIHDIGYLFKKGQNRNTHYDKSEVQSTDIDLLNAQWEDTADPLQAMTQRVVELYTIRQMSLSEIMQQGIIPPNLLYYFKTLLDGIGDPVKRKGEWREFL